jgi:hypothetical protein
MTICLRFRQSALQCIYSRASGHVNGTNSELPSQPMQVLVALAMMGGKGLDLFVAVIEGIAS